MTGLGVVTTIPSTRRAVEFAKAAEGAGFSRVGFADTAPRLYHAVYPAVTASLLATSTINVGPYVTNAVTRHWSVQAGTARALDDLAPGRFFMGLATGDGAVHSVGLRPAKLADFEDYVSNLIPLAPPDVNLHMVFSGLGGVQVAGRLASELTIGTGLDGPALRELADRARVARRAAGNTAPLGIWAMASTHLAQRESDVPRLRQSVKGLAFGGARFAFDFSFAGKNVPSEYQPIIEERLRRYDFAYHGKIGDNPNARLFEDQPDIENYLLDRMLLIGTPDQCAERLDALSTEAGLDGVWMPMLSAGEDEAALLANVRTAGAAFSTALRPT